MGKTVPYHLPNIEYSFWKTKQNMLNCKLYGFCPYTYCGFRKSLIHFFGWRSFCKKKIHPSKLKLFSLSLSRFRHFHCFVKKWKNKRKNENMCKVQLKFFVEKNNIQRNLLCLKFMHFYTILGILEHSAFLMVLG